MNRNKVNIKQACTNGQLNCPLGQEKSAREFVQIMTFEVLSTKYLQIFPRISYIGLWLEKQNGNWTANPLQWFCTTLTALKGKVSPWYKGAPGINSLLPISNEVIEHINLFMQAYCFDRVASISFK